MVRVVAGGSGTDSIGMPLADTLVVRLADSAGVPLPGVAVHFDAARISELYGQSSYQVTLHRVDTLPGRLFEWFAMASDARGEARALVSLGMRAGPESLFVSVPEVGFVDTLVYLARPGGPAALRVATHDTTVTTGNSMQLPVTVIDRGANVLPIAPQYSGGGTVASVDASGRATGGAPGLGTIALTLGTLHDTIRVYVVPTGTIVVVEDQGDGWHGITTLALDGSNRKRLTRTTDVVEMPRWSPDGDTIAYSEGRRGLDAHLYTVTIDGVRRRLMTTVPSGLYEDFFPQYSRDGQWIYFTGITPSRYYAGEFESTGWRVRADGSGAEQLLRPDGWTQGWAPSPSPNGTTVVLDREGFLFTMDVTTDAYASLSDAAGIPQNTIGGLMPEYSPDGSTIAYQDVRPGLEGPLFVVGANASGWRQVSPQYYEQFGGFSWSPDGQWIVARRSDLLEIVRVSDGLRIPLLHSAAMRQPAWRP